MNQHPLKSWFCNTLASKASSALFPKHLLSHLSNQWILVLLLSDLTTQLQCDILYQWILRCYTDLVYHTDLVYRNEHMRCFRCFLHASPVHGHTSYKNLSVGKTCLGRTADAQLCSYSSDPQSALHNMLFTASLSSDHDVGTPTQRSSMKTQSNQWRT